MKKLKNSVFWIGVLAIHLVAFVLFGLIIALSLNLPDTMLGGMTSLSLVICGLIFAADDEDRALLKRLVVKDKKMDNDTPQG